ncbi:TrbL/VirB6 plasmid conjugal transfer protein [Actinomadura rubteroloni]|uniref:TrbL/VirB6 plasmid conjugal transfer protein n=1 Tax=Actinomadura rubteroloni TaxID=1926885 RepID=A0A2P4UJ69_9ACTN|nr:type IV secretion system protein [Actinomadura rubteroloni]POM25080.1 TrbL/VirB6 plasmid conjugal transfer protein [Actinomadura rubteroloni]
MNRPHAALAGAAALARRAGRGPAGFQTSPGAGLDPRRIDRARRPARRRPRTRRSALLLTLMALFLLSPLTPASASIPLPSVGDACRPADNPSPEQYGSGTDGLIKPPDYPNAKLQKTPAQNLTYYDRYGTAGQSWYAVDMGCSDAMAMMGNALANTTFTLVRAIDRTTISVYQAAASESLLGWLKGTIDDVISSIGKTFNTRYWSWVVIVGAITLAWWGLVRRRASKVVEGVVWMVAAMVALIWLVSRPADFTTLGTKVSEATSAAFNAALPQSSTKGGTCVPTPDGKPDPSTSANTDPTTRNANGLWVALVCKPWLMGEFGTTDPNAAIVKDNADKLLWSQAVDLPETYGGQKVDLAKKADAYKDVTKNIKDQHAGAYPLFQGKNWTSRLAVAFGALFAALVAGLLILVIAIALIVVKISFLLLLVAGPIFLGIGIQPGIGRVIAMRWLELLLSMLLKQAALIGVLALLLWAYGLILGETLPWGLQILLIALVTFAAFVYRKPFQHLFSAVGYSAVGGREKSEALLDRSASEARKNTAGVVTAVVPGAAGYRLGRAGKRDGAVEPATTDAADRRTGVAAAGAGDPQSPDAAPVLAAKPKGGAAGQGRPRKSAPPLNLPSRATTAPDGGGTTAPRTTGGGTNGSGGGIGGIVTGGRSSGAGGGSGDGGSGGSGSGSPRPPSWGRGGGDGNSGGGGKSGSGSGGGGRGGRNGSSPARGGGKDPASGVPRQRGGSGGGKSGGGSGGGNSGRNGGGNSGGSGGGNGAAPPPLWASRRTGGGGDGAPPMPFWLRPVDGDEP